MRPWFLSGEMEERNHAALRRREIAFEDYRLVGFLNMNMNSTTRASKTTHKVLATSKNTGLLVSARVLFIFHTQQLL